jgi:N-acetyl-beta-hexosaminidase
LESAGQEAYRLKLRPEGGSLTAREAAGFFGGIQTLRQLVANRQPAAIVPVATTGCRTMQRPWAGRGRS